MIFLIWYWTPFPTSPTQSYVKGSLCFLQDVGQMMDSSPTQTWLEHVSHVLHRRGEHTCVKWLKTFESSSDSMVSAISDPTKISTLYIQRYFLFNSLKSEAISLKQFQRRRSAVSWRFLSRQLQFLLFQSSFFFFSQTWRLFPKTSTEKPFCLFLKWQFVIIFVKSLKH